ncbi:hypothetical protein KQX54_002125 [Cotesia glomerata]|uniref:Endonuclease/exonuclease/phosphatase domain-containing protein n=1 Tax=Cotesia glomerata TaxID=32391 RepID=A0AAV7I5Y7_COTGL|nr:hypothetical protein KQX54_002125 [Cotesia glomerata]
MMLFILHPLVIIKLLNTIINLPNADNLDLKTYFISIYTTPDNKKAIRDELDTLCVKLDLSNPNATFLMAGDLNARHKLWGDSKINERDKYLAKWELEMAPNLRAKIFPPCDASYNPNKEFLLSPPEDRNLSIAEIDDLIDKISGAITNSIESTVPQFKKQDSVLKYVNSRIKKLQKNKSHLITKLHKLYKTRPPDYQQQIFNTKHTIKLIKIELEK